MNLREIFPNEHISVDTIPLFPIQLNDLSEQTIILVMLILHHIVCGLANATELKIILGIL